MIPVAMPVLMADLNTSEIAAFSTGGNGLGLAGSGAGSSGRLKGTRGMSGLAGSGGRGLSGGTGRGLTVFWGARPDLQRRVKLEHRRCNSGERRT